MWDKRKVSVVLGVLLLLGAGGWSVYSSSVRTSDLVEDDVAPMMFAQAGDGPIEPYRGHVRWDETQGRLEIDVEDLAAGGYTQLFVAADGVEQHVPWPASEGHPWIQTTIDGVGYMQVTLNASTPVGPVVFAPFVPGPGPLYSKGSPESVLLYAVDDLFFRAAQPMKVEVKTESAREIHVEKQGRYRLQINADWLASIGVSEPHFLVDGRTVDYLPAWDGKSWYVPLDGAQSVQILEGERWDRLKWEGIVEAGIVLVGGTMEEPVVLVPAIVPWLEKRWSRQMAVHFDVCDDPSCGLGETSALGLLYYREGQGWGSWNVTPERWRPSSGHWRSAHMPTFQVSFGDFGEVLMAPERIRTHVDTVFALVQHDDPGPCQPCVRSWLTGVGLLGIPDLTAHPTFPIPPLPLVPEWPAGAELPGGAAFAGVPQPPFPPTRPDPLPEVGAMPGFTMPPTRSIEPPMEPSVLVLRFTGSNAYFALDPLEYASLLPSEEGRVTLRVSVDGSSEHAGERLRLWVTCDGSVIYEEVRTPQEGSTISFSGVPALLGATYRLAVGDTVYVLEFFQERYSAPSSPVSCRPGID